MLPVIQRVNKRGAAAAANKQSNLDTYFGDSIGRVGGSAIPRKRQAYTSKRLQKVVTDYREEQKRRSRTTTKKGDSTLLDSDRSNDKSMEDLDADDDLPVDFGEDLDIDGSDYGERDPRSGSVTRTGETSKPTATTKTPTKRTALGEKRKARKSAKNASTASRSAKRKKRANDSDDYDDEGGAEIDEVAPVPARPRPKPVRKKANITTDAGSKIDDQGLDGQST